MTPALELTDDGETLIMSPTQLETWKTCAMMGRWRYLFRRVSSRDNAAQTAGKSFDAAINLRYTKLGSAPANLAMEAEMHDLVDAGFEGVDLPLDEYRTSKLFKEAVTEYNKCWGHEPFEVLGVQVPVAVTLGYAWDMSVHPGKRVRVILQGILDKLIRTPDGHVLVSDTKTMNSYTDRTIVQWENASQPKAYAFAIQELARCNPGLGLPAQVHGFMLNAVVIRKPYAEGRTPPKNALPRFELHRPRVYYTAERLEEWRQHTLDWVGMALGWVANDRFPMNEQHCGNHYGAACPYLGVCMSAPEQREDVLESDLYRDYERGPQWLAAQSAKDLLDTAQAP